MNTASTFANLRQMKMDTLEKKLNEGENTMTFYEITEKDRELIRVALECLERNFDDGVYNHTVGCALLG